jgi:hypothetical protein
MSTTPTTAIDVPAMDLRESGDAQPRNARCAQEISVERGPLFDLQGGIMRRLASLLVVVVRECLHPEP